MVDFVDIVRRRRMTRAFRPDPVSPDLLTDLVDLAARAPSAGKTQGWHLISLVGPQTRRFWDSTLPSERRATFRWQHLLDAPVILLPLADRGAYLERYSEPDKAVTGLGADADAWPVPYWTVDTAMAVMTLLLAAENAGLGALFFGVFNGEAALRAQLKIPDELDLLGAIALGYPADGDESGRSAARPRRKSAEIVHHGGWTGGETAAGVTY